MAARGGLVIRALHVLPGHDPRLQMAPLPANGEARMPMWCGIDWAEKHHDVAIIDEAGTVRARLRIDDDPGGFTRLLAVLAEHRQDPDTPIPVAIETAKGLLVANLLAAGVPVFAINPLSVSRYRDRHSPSRAKSDAGDALVLAHILRTDGAAHRAVPDDSELAQSIRQL